MKTQEELNQLKEEYETLHQRLEELNEDELEQVTGGKDNGKTPLDQYMKKLCPDKSKILVDAGEESQLKLDAHVAYEANNLHIVKRQN